MEFYSACTLFLAGTIYPAICFSCIYLVRHFALLPPESYRMQGLLLMAVLYVVCDPGKLVEEEEGNFALWLSYILTGAGANLVSWLVLPRNAVSIGASGAVFGLFAVSVLVKVWF